MKQLLLFFIRLYQLVPRGPLLLNSGACRFSPTCSTYCYQAVKERGTIRGLILCARRVAKCNPLYKN